MTNNAQRLRQITLKIKRAKEHIAELERQVRAFMETNPYKVGVKRDPQTRNLIYYIISADAIPDCLTLIAGDAIQNLMSSLDYLAYQLVCSDTRGTPPNPRWIYFPIADDASKYEAKKQGKIKGVRQETFEAIDALKPYKGGNDLLWVLYRLNNIEKHRLLLTVGSQHSGINIGQVMAQFSRDTFPSNVTQWFESMGYFLRPSDGGFPLEPGLELDIFPADTEPNPKLQFRFEIALNEPGIIEGKPLIETLHQLTTLVEDIVIALNPRLT